MHRMTKTGERAPEGRRFPALRGGGSEFRGINLALGPANMVSIIFSMVSGFRTLVAAT